MAVAHPVAQSLETGLGACNQRIWAVFEELVYRHRVLIQTKRREICWRTLFLSGCFVTTTGIVTLLFPWHLARLQSSWWIAGLLLFDYLVFARFRVSRRALQKAGVNFGVIRHHLMGMLEVELCNCPGPCHCKQQFCREALIRYGVNLYH